MLARLWFWLLCFVFLLPAGGSALFTSSRSRILRGWIQLLMERAVFSLRQCNQILRAIVFLITIDMMYDFVSKQLATVRFFPYDYVLSHVSIPRCSSRKSLRMFGSVNVPVLASHSARGFTGWVKSFVAATVNKEVAILVPGITDVARWKIFGYPPTATAITWLTARSNALRAPALTKTSFMVSMNKTSAATSLAASFGMYFSAATTSAKHFLTSNNFIGDIVTLNRGFVK